MQNAEKTTTATTTNSECKRFLGEDTVERVVMFAAYLIGLSAAKL